MTSAISILKFCDFFFDNFSNFPGTFRSSRSFEIFSSNSLRRCDFFHPNFVKIRTILGIFWTFEDFRFSRRALSAICNIYRELWLIDCQYGCILFRSFWRSFGGRSGIVLQIVSGAGKKTFDRGSPVWPPRSNAADHRLRGGSVWWGKAPPSPKPVVLGAAPPSQKRKGSCIKRFLY